MQRLTKKAIRAAGADGLCAEDCGCGLDDLRPCGDKDAPCIPAFAYRCQCGKTTYHPLEYRGDPELACCWCGQVFDNKRRLNHE